MCTDTQRCSAWVSLQGMEGCLRSPSWLKQVRIPIQHSTAHPSLYVDSDTERLTCVRTVSHGAFGYIDWGIYEHEECKEGVYIKRPIHAGKSLLYEACMQHLVHARLLDIGFPQGAPSVRRIFRLQDESIGFAMEPVEGACTLDHYLATLPDSSLSYVLVECLLQLCAMIWHLSVRVGINHRDLTPSNFMVVDHPTRRKVLTVDTHLLEISSTRSLTLIDFGFSCLGSPDTHRAQLSLSTVYPAEDPCPKEGRDLYLLIGLLYIEYHARLPVQIRGQMEQWLDESGGGLCRMMRRDRESSKKWLYFMVGNDQITQFRTTPLKMIQDLESYQ